MRIHLLMACAASLTFALGLAALPATAQNNNVAFNRRLTLSDPAKASSQPTHSAVLPAAAALPATSFAPTPTGLRPVPPRQPVGQQPVAQQPAVRTVSPPTTDRTEVIAADTIPRQPVLQPAVRPTHAASPAPLPVAAPTSAAASPLQSSAPRRVEAAPALQTAPAPLAPKAMGDASTAVSPPATIVHSRRILVDEPKPIAESIVPTVDSGCGDPSCGDCDDCGCDDCGGNGWFGGGLRRGSGRWLAGVEFLFARPHFSEAVAYILHQNPTLGPGNILTASDTYVHHNFDYEPSARGYVAYRLDDCCAELRGTYTRLQSDSSRSASPDANATIVPTYFEVQPAPGDTLTSTLDVGGDVFDVDFSRCLRAGGECRPCDCRTCPEWDLSWSAGARLARWDFNGDVFTTDPTDGRLDMDQEFIGAGPKIGLEGRRYFGRHQQFSVFSSFDASLLVGWYEYRMDRTTPSVGVNPATRETFISKVTRTIPVTEIELGVDWQPYERLNISAGWFFQAWWDLGISTQQPSNLLGGIGPQFLLDDSNIMSWDGLMLRAELSF